MRREISPQSGIAPTSASGSATFSRSSACTWPRRTSSETLSFATTPGNALVIPSTRSASSDANGGTSQRTDEGLARRDRPEDAALHLDHLQGGLVVAAVCRTRAV